MNKNLVPSMQQGGLVQRALPVPMPSDMLKRFKGGPFVPFPPDALIRNVENKGPASLMRGRPPLRIRDDLFETTVNFPPDVGGMQILMGGLTKSLLEHGPVKVFANEFPGSDLYDKKISAEVNRISGIKLFRKYRKAILVNDFIEKNANIR